MVNTVPDPELEMGGGGEWAAVIQTLRKGGGGLRKIFFDLRASIWSENKGGGGVPGPFPWMRHCNNKRSNDHGHEDCRIL